MNYIIGSGLIGLMAKDILGDSWDIIPHGTSRYYSWAVPLADDFVPVSAKNDYKVLLTPNTKIIKRAFSLGGQLIFAPLRWVSDIYTNKVFGNPLPVFNRVVEMEQMVSVKSCRDIYKNLLGKYMDVLTQRSEQYGVVSSIANGEIKTTTTTLQYDNIISTIPLDALLKCLGETMGLESKDAWIYHVRTSRLDFEGASQVLVADNEFDFYKVNKIGPSEYIFFCLKEIVTPTQYFGAFTGNHAEVIGQSYCKSFIPIADSPPNLSWLNDKYKIQCVGSHAQWDALADVGSCFARLLKLSI